MKTQIARFGRAEGFAGCCFFIIVFLSTSCSHAIGSGRRMTQPRAVVDFDTIEVSGTMDMTIQVGDAPSLLISGDNNIVPAVQSAVNGRTLKIRVPKGAFQKERVEVVVATPRLNGIRAAITENVSIDVWGEPLDELDIVLSGVGKLVLNEVMAHRIYASVSGTGKLEMTGMVDVFDFKMSGMGRGSFESLCVESAMVRVNGMGKVTVNVSKELNAIVKGFGRVEYIGNPDLSPIVNGRGTIRYIEKEQNICRPPAAT